MFEVTAINVTATSFDHQTRIKNLRYHGDQDQRAHLFDILC